MPVTFVAYIDESGDTGLDLVKKSDDPKGATEWLVLSAFLVRVANDSKMVAWTQDVQEKITSKRADLHFNKLLPEASQKLRRDPGFGVKPMPMLHEMKLTDPQKQIFTSYGANANSWKKK
jgi:hypothetical protein